MFYERKIGSFAELMEEAASMDADAGLRILGKYDGKRCYVFVTRFGDRYTAMIYEGSPGTKRRAGRRLAVQELEGVEELESLIKKVVSHKVTAFAY